MQIGSSLRNRLLAAAIFAVVLASAPVRAHAVSKEIIELQTQVQQLLDMVQRLQSTLDTRFGVLQNLAQQTADQAKQMSTAVNDLQQKLNAQTEAANGKIDTVSGQVQTLNDSVDELKSRIAKLDKSVQDLQTQLQNIQTPPQPAVTPGGAPGSTFPGGGPAGPLGSLTPNAPAANQAPPLQETFQSGLRDYNAAKYQVASSEFQDILHYYPLDDLAGTAQFYLGEIAYQQKNYADAVIAYNAVLEGFSGNPKAPAAQLHKGLALMAQNKREAGIHELRLLIQRYPRTPEAASARSRLNGMGVRLNPH
ncbi:MAG TPA: tetratricopeptide repeat protein [Terracidiphilus sp.]|nr:tetratricopeptide repeat protein [Terracidiphilus sp.]